MTSSELKELEKIAHKPLGVKYLDDLFKITTTAIYYRFMYHLVKAMNPDLIVELGVCTGRGTAHLAAAKESCKVIGFDPDPHEDLSAVLKKFPNITWMACSSLDRFGLDK